MPGGGDITDSAQDDPVKLYFFRHFKRAYNILYHNSRRRPEGSMNQVAEPQNVEESYVPVFILVPQVIRPPRCKWPPPNVGISCGRVRRPGGPARRVPCRRRDGSGRQLPAELYGLCLLFLHKHLKRVKSIINQSVGKCISYFISSRNSK